MKTVGTKLDNSEYEIFDFCCKENGLTKSEQLRDLIKNFMDKPKESTTPTIVEPKSNVEPIITIVDV